MSELRTGRRRYYNIFSHFYDLFIKLHSRDYGEETRKFLADSSQSEDKTQPRILDICCGTGSVVLAFAKRSPDLMAIGYDFSRGMLLRAYKKDLSHKIIFIEGDAAALPFANDSFDVVCCSHALYELKGNVRKYALLEMKRVVKPDGSVLIMEHEVPNRLLIRFLFYIRMLLVGRTDSREFLAQGIYPFRMIFSGVDLLHTKSGKTRLIVCHK